MRSFSAAIAATLLAAVGLTGCTVSSAAASCTREPVGEDAIGLLTITGSRNVAPTVVPYTPLHVDGVAYADIESGVGTPITTGTQLVSMEMTLVSGDSGEVVFQSSYNGDNTDLLYLGSLEESLPGLSTVLRCAAEGSRVAAVLGPDEIGQGVVEGFGLGEGDSLIAVLDIDKVFLPKAEGSLVYNTGAGLPSVVRAPDGRPGIIVPVGEAPTEIVIETLIKGTGDEVTGETPIRVAYTGVEWEDGAVFGSSWGDEPAGIGFDEGDVVADALIGQTVGSQVMVVIPGSEMTPTAGEQPGARVLVIDILGIEEVAETDAP